MFAQTKRKNADWLRITFLIANVKIVQIFWAIIVYEEKDLLEKNSSFHKGSVLTIERDNSYLLNPKGKDALQTMSHKN